MEKRESLVRFWSDRGILHLNWHYRGWRYRLSTGAPDEELG